MDLKEAIEIVKTGEPRPLNWKTQEDWYDARELVMEALGRHPRILYTLLERERHITGEGWTPEHDDQHINGELAWAGSAYAAEADQYAPGEIPWSWPWATSWWKPSRDPQRNLVKAQALLLAEQERLDRAETRKGVGRG
jgi:hypothetical protein